MLEGIEAIFVNRTQMLDRLTKVSYKSRMDDFVEQYGHYIQEMLEDIDMATDKEGAAIEVGKVLFAGVKKCCVNRKGKLEIRTRSEIALFFVYYIFPLMLKGGENGKILADGVLLVCQKELKNKEMRYTDYETLYYGFHEKKFGLF